MRVFSVSWRGLRLRITLLALAGLLGCHPSGNFGIDDSDKLDKHVDLERLMGRWVHAHEEDDGDRVVYRASGYSFPPSRGRDAFTLDENGVVQIDHPGPADRGESATGHWVLDGNTLSIDAGNWSARFSIESFDGITLVMHRR